MIHVVATITLHAGERQKYLKILKANAPLVLAEAGCRGYAPCIDVATGLPAQAPLRPDVVIIVEAWDDLEALKTHLAAPHMAEYRKKVKDLVRSVSLQVVEAVPI